METFAFHFRHVNYIYEGKTIFDFLKKKKQTKNITGHEPGSER